MKSYLVVLAVLAAVAAFVAGHGSLVNPRPRNSIDRPPYGPNRCQCANSTNPDQCDNGQACYWYNQGCFIGCPTCDSISGREQTDLCGLGKEATINDPKLRTVNRNGTGIYDIYKHNPWRAPGSAPVVDSCGLAGGTPWAANVSEWGEYVATQFAKHGDFGSKTLPVLSTGTVWKIGGVAETTWQIRANHGGGVQYRLCPLGEPLTEECFFKTPLDFVEGAQQLVWSNGTRLTIGGTFTRNGTLPEGSMWSMNPIPPRCLGGSCSYSQPFCQPCPLPVKGRDCTSCDNNPDPCFPPPCDEGDLPGLCSGNQPGPRGLSVAVVDQVKVPSHLAPGKYVLGWRMDCEATAQVWNNCADITLIA